MSSMDTYTSQSGRLVPVFRMEINTRPDDAERLLDAIFAVCPLTVGAYERNATVTAQGAETGRPGEQTVTRIHNDAFEADGTEVYPSVELKVSFERDVGLLQKIMEAVLHAHQYEEPIIHVREEWASRANYTPRNENPNRWWNDGRGTPGKVSLDQSRR
ncbi:hypothetical protein KUV47_10560 [Vannielia litorea]|uniref:hypothetical protein n=1 Tax=Vannielia litorea TaxID=1217970 RepID=UPI001C955223|nr:hypothetical protein [Vannielia litorea]MBY6153654.1 hypothetical protein [Vannielia litorea]